MNANASAPMTAPRTARQRIGTALGVVSLLLSCLLLAGLVARFGWSPVTDTLIVVEFLFVLVVAPRLTKRLISHSLPDLTAAHVTPALRAETDRLLESLLKSSSVPSAEQLAGAVVAALKVAQQEAVQGAPDPVERVRVVFREELQAALDQLESEPVEAVEGSQAMAQKSAEVRRANAEQEKAFLAAVQSEGGILAALAVDTLRETNRRVYQGYAYKGLAGAQELKKDHESGRLAGLTGAAGAAAGRPAGQRFI